jgi:hypothetical protein
MGFMQILSAGDAPPPPYASGAIGTSFNTPQTSAFNATRKKYGTLDDPDAGGYNLAQIDWNKDDGTTVVGHLEPTDDGWMA